MPVDHPSDVPATRAALADPSRAEMLSTLAAGTLHDMSNLLVLVLGCAELVLDDPALAPRSRRLIEDAIQAGERAGALAQQMLAFARGDAHAPAGMVDVAAALRAAEPLVRRVAGRAVAVSIDTGPAPLWVRATAVDLDRIVVNLVSNGRDAMPGGGRLLLRVAPALAHPDLQAGGPVVRLTVTDTGHGIDPAVRERLFDAFASTRSDDGHWGLGLAVVRAVVGHLGGAVRVTAAPGGGTTFVVDLPAVQPPPDL